MTSLIITLSLAALADDHCVPATENSPQAWAEELGTCILPEYNEYFGTPGRESPR